MCAREGWEGRSAADSRGARISGGGLAGGGGGGRGGVVAVGDIWGDIWGGYMGPQTVELDLRVRVGVVLRAAAVLVGALVGALTLGVGAGPAGLLFAPDDLAPLAKVLDFLELSACPDGTRGSTEKQIGRRTSL